MNLRDMLSDRILMQKTMHCSILFLWNAQKQQMYEREARAVSAWLQGMGVVYWLTTNRM
jgi:hypothetical protein